MDAQKPPWSIPREYRHRLASTQYEQLITPCYALERARPYYGVEGKVSILYMGYRDNKSCFYERLVPPC